MYNERNIILASQSPRRRQILKQVGVRFEVLVGHCYEQFYGYCLNEEIPMHISSQKAYSVLPMVNSDSIILAADTIVVLDGRIIGKPSSKEESQRILSSLSGRFHEVITGVTLLDFSKEVRFFESTIVWFRRLFEEDIQYYIHNFETLDKAGAYAIQDWIGLIGIYKVEGCYYNVVGLPISRVISEIQSF